VKATNWLGGIHFRWKPLKSCGLPFKEKSSFLNW
jgi:hypothetical protein